jgi:threonine/homoserine/homoserine lactone efflux protein
MDLPEPGRWRVTVSVRSPAGPGTAAFEVTVVRAAPVTWFLLAVIGGTLVLWLGWRRARARTAPGDEPGHQGEAHH